VKKQSLKTLWLERMGEFFERTVQAFGLLLAKLLAEPD
jgi:hypothetical protein